MLSNIRDILIIVNKGQLDQYKKILPNGDNLGIKNFICRTIKAKRIT